MHTEECKKKDLIDEARTAYAENHIIEAAKLILDKKIAEEQRRERSDSKRTFRMPDNYSKIDWSKTDND